MPFESLPAVLSEASPVGERFAAAGHRVFLVGGIVRDLWLDRELGPHIDLDLTTDALPEQTKEILGPLADAMWLQGERFGTIGALITGRPYEITTHRAESYVAHSRKPDVSYAGAIEEDLSRRDFTVNAMAVELPSGDLIDPFDGARDLADRQLRTPIDPDLSFADDPLRMLRAARFVAGYGLEPIAQVVDAMSALASRLDIVSVERIRDELDKLLSTERPSTGLQLLVNTGVLERVLPEVDRERLSHRAGAVDAAPRRPDVRLALLLAGTEPASARRRVVALRCSNDRVDYVAKVLDAALRIGELAVDVPSYRRWYRDAAGHGNDARLVALAADPRLEPVVEAMDAVHRRLGSELDDFSAPIDGREVMELLGLTEGPTVGEAMAHLDELRLEQGPLDADSARTALRAWWESRSGRSL